MRNLNSFWTSLLGAFLLVACGGSEPFTIEIASRDDCNGVENIYSGHTVRVTVRGPGMSSVSAEADGSEPGIEIPEVPEGKDRVVVVEVFAGGDSRQLFAWGESEPFEVTAESTPHVRVNLYRTNYFAEVVGTNGQCSKMNEVRAGHIAAPLSKNEVLLAGGYKEKMGDNFNGLLASAEIFDLRSGSYRLAEPMPYARAFSRSVVLPDGRILVMGGVREVEGGQVPAGDAFIYSRGKWTTVPMVQARRDFSATWVKAAGVVLVVGGVDAEGQIVSTVEVFDPAAERFREVDLEGGAELFVRAFHGDITQGDNNVLIVGGIDEAGKVTGNVSSLTWDVARSKFVAQPLYSLDQAVLLPGLFVFGTATQYLVVSGGFTSFVPWDPAKPGIGVPGSESRNAQYLTVLGGISRGALEMDAPVGDTCSMAFDAARGILVGGSRSTGMPADVGLFLEMPPGQGLRQSRAGESNDRRGALQHMACAPIGDGAFLISGGFNHESTVTDRSLIYRKD